MTLEELKAEPLLVGREVILRVTGWSKTTFYKQIEANVLKPACKLPGGGQQFRRSDVEKLVRS